MTLYTLYLLGKETLAKAELESPAFDAVCLFSKIFGMHRHELALNGEHEADRERAGQYLALITRRASREPLQYILGIWTFMGMDLHVGEGVLIPREDTRVLVEEGLRLIRDMEKEQPVVYDLCAGSGAVAAGIARGCPQARIYCFELSGKALPYLRKNLHVYAPQARWVQLDVLKALPGKDVPKPDIVLSNPPYIPTGDLQSLPEEVRREPEQALDGGVDGLAFYRAVARNWCALLPKGGCVSVEVGMGQTEAVRGIFEEQGLETLRVARDLSGIERVVSASVTLDSIRG